MSHSDLPGRPASVWLATAPETDYEALTENRRVDTAVVGGGIAGLTTATLLAERGREVALLECDRIGHGVTGHTTAKLTTQHGLLYDALERNHDRRTARQYAAANLRAVEFVAERVADDGIDCRFERRPAYAFSDGADQTDRARREVEAARRAGLPASLAEDVAVGSPDAAVRFDGQAQFDPQQYLLGLASAFTAAGSHLFEGTRVRDVDGGPSCRVTTDQGSVVADSVVVATHFPMLDRAGYFARQYPKRSYVLAVRARDAPTKGMYYRTGDSYLSARTATVEGETLTLVGGQNHKTGQGGSTAARYRRLAALARDHFDVDSIEYRWSTQDYVSVDKLPYVGRLGPFERNVYTATGFGGWGMSNGTAAGMMLADVLTDRPNQQVEAFDPLRATVRASAEEFASENANVASRFAGGWAEKLSSSDRPLNPDEATVRRAGTDVVGVYRDEHGTDHLVDAVCPHMGCPLEWNDGERTWDCPCHGSRFQPDGSVIDGPATEDLNYERPDRSDRD